MPKVYDPIDGDESDRWFPEGKPARLLVACVQACKKILKTGASLSRQRPSADRRGMMLLASHVLSLVDNTIALQKSLGKVDRTKWPARDEEKFTEAGKQLRKTSSGPFRKLRNYRSAHDDAMQLNAKSAPPPTPEVLLPPLKFALIALTIAFNHDRAFQWFRIPDKANPDEYDYFIEVAARVRVEHVAGGKIRPIEILGLTVMADPRFEAFEAVKKTISLYNRLVKDDGHPEQQITLTRFPKKPEAKPRRTAPA